MASPASLFALASGRLTPLSRAALVLGLGLFGATILLVRPVHLAAPRLGLERPSVLALGHDSPWVERAQLQEGSALFMPGNGEDIRSGDAAQPDASPFPPFGPELRHDPAKPLALPSSDATPRWAGLDEAFPMREDKPYQTLGEKPSRAAPRARLLSIQVISDNNESVLRKDFAAGDPLIKSHKLLNDRDLKITTAVEFRLGLDGMGLESRPYLLRSSGHADWDQAAGEWLGGLPWSAWLKPGSYRVVVGP